MLFACVSNSFILLKILCLAKWEVNLVCSCSHRLLSLIESRCDPASNWALKQKTVRWKRLVHETDKLPGCWAKVALLHVWVTAVLWREEVLLWTRLKDEACVCPTTEDGCTELAAVPLHSAQYAIENCVWQVFSPFGFVLSYVYG